MLDANDSATMKLRIRDNTIRLRLTRTEVDTLRDVGLVGATLNFPGGTMIEYVLESTPASVSLSAQFANNTIRIRLPESTVKEWAEPLLLRMHRNKVRMALARRLLIGIYVMMTRGDEFSLDRCLAR